MEPDVTSVPIYPWQKYVVEIPAQDASRASDLGCWQSMSDTSPVRLQIVTGDKLPDLLKKLATLEVKVLVKDYETADVILFLSTNRPARN